MKKVTLNFHKATDYYLIYDLQFPLLIPFSLNERDYKHMRWVNLYKVKLTLVIID